MNKSELVDLMSEISGLTKVDSKKALDAFIDATGRTLAQGDSVSLIGFGTFSTSDRAARTGRNPRTGAKLKIPATKVVRFKAGAGLSELVKK